MATIDVDVLKETDVPELIPARMLNEFAYCPRLCYLEWVQGEFADNLETREGRFGHRRVDRADRKPVPEPAGRDGDEDGPHPGPLPEGEGASVGPLPVGEGETGPHPGPLPEGEGESLPADVEPVHSRSVMLSAPEEGLIAKIDLLEVQAGMAVPVDYKRGRVPDVPGGAWEPEQVQLCAQGLILRENGYLCEGGILYYVDSRRRVSIPFEEPLVERTRELIQEMRAVASSGEIPPPLDDSPKCPRCSLVGICLPDETRLLAEPDALTPGPSSAAEKPRPH